MQKPIEKGLKVRMDDGCGYGLVIILTQDELKALYTVTAHMTIEGHSTGNVMTMKFPTLKQAAAFIQMMQQAEVFDISKHKYEGEGPCL